MNRSFLAVALVAALGCGESHDHSKHDHKAAPAPTAGDYPLKTCVVSGEALGSMGEPVKVSHEGREIRLCCKNCEKGFQKDPAKFAKMVEDAAAKKN